MSDQCEKWHWSEISGSTGYGDLCFATLEAWSAAGCLCLCWSDLESFLGKGLKYLTPSKLWCWVNVTYSALEDEQGCVAHELSLFALPVPGLHQGRQGCFPEWCEISSLKEKGRILAYSGSNNSFLGLYLDVIQLHLQKAALPYAAGLP